MSPFVQTGGKNQITRRPRSKSVSGNHKYLLNAWMCEGVLTRAEEAPARDKCSSRNLTFKCGEKN